MITYLRARVFLLLRLRRRTRFFLHLALILCLLDYLICTGEVVVSDLDGMVVWSQTGEENEEGNGELAIGMV